MSLVPVRRIWEMQRFYIERKRQDNLLLISDSVSLFPEQYYLDSSVDFNGMRTHLPFPWEMSPQAIHQHWVQREFHLLQSPSIPCRTLLCFFFCPIQIVQSLGVFFLWSSFSVFKYLKRELSQLLLAIVCS